MAQIKKGSASFYTKGLYSKLLNDPLKQKIIALLTKGSMSFYTTGYVHDN